MSNLINKAKEAISGSHHDNPSSHNAGPHSSNMANKVDPRVDSDMDHRNDPTSNVGGRGNTQTTGYGPDGSSGYGAGVGHGTAPTAGTGNTMHSSNLANKADPRVDSDFDHRGNPNSGVGGHGASHTAGGYGQTGHTSATTGGTGTAMHSSQLANKLDPRVDSDFDHRANPASNVGGHGNAHAGTGADTGAGYSDSGYAGAAGTGVTGGNAGNTMHSSQMANKVDPRVDSDFDHRANPASNVGGYGGPHGSTGAHDSMSTVGGSGVGHTGAAGTGNAGYTETTATGGHAGQSTHAPHNSNLLNKMDPRVKVDKDGRPL